MNCRRGRIMTGVIIIYDQEAAWDRYTHQYTSQTCQRKSTVIIDAVFSTRYPQITSRSQSFILAEAFKVSAGV